MCEPIKTTLLEFEGRQMQVHKVYHKIQEIQAWLAVRLEKTFHAEYTRRLSEDGLSTKQATELSQQFQNVVKAMHSKLKRYMDGEQPAMEFFSAVRLLDPMQHATLNTNFAMLKLPFVKPQVQQEWQKFINICSDPTSISNPDLVLYCWHSLLSTLPSLASIALSSLAVPPANVDVGRSFSIYKNVLADNRQNLKFENLAMLVQVKFNVASGLLQPV